MLSWSNTPFFFAISLLLLFLMNRNWLSWYLSHWNFLLILFSFCSLSFENLNHSCCYYNYDNKESSHTNTYWYLIFLKESVLSYTIIKKRLKAVVDFLDCWYSLLKLIKTNKKDIKCLVFFFITSKAWNIVFVLIS